MAPECMRARVARRQTDVTANRGHVDSETPEGSPRAMKAQLDFIPIFRCQDLQVKTYTLAE